MKTTKMSIVIKSRLALPIGLIALISTVYKCAPNLMGILSLGFPTAEDKVWESFL
jgi:hypothetical protein